MLFYIVDYEPGADTGLLTMGAWYDIEGVSHYSYGVWGSTVSCVVATCTFNSINFRSFMTYGL